MPLDDPVVQKILLISALYVFALAAFLGYQVISRVPPLLHTPLMSATNAISGISLVGSIVIDLAGATGGNCALSQADVTVEREGVTIIAPTNLPATIPVHASQLYSRNVTSFLSLLIKDGQLNIDMKDDVVGPSCVTHNGEIVNQRVAAALQAQPG